MSDHECPHEARVLEAARSDDWSPELEAHRNGCLSCAELTLVAAALGTDSDALADIDRPLPDPELIWLRAQLANRERDCQRATRTITWVQRMAVAAAIAVGFAFAPGLWDVVAGAVRDLDLALPSAGLPRAAGSPLLVVVGSLMVLGSLALWELATVRDR
jgi:hypothetical protein